MGVTARTARFRTPVGLALVLALAGTTTSGRHAESADQVSSPSAGSAAPPASVTRIEPRAYPSGAQLPAAVRIVATSVTGQGRPARVDIASVLLAAYRSAAASAPSSCHLPVSLLAGIGQVESGSLAGVPLDARHRASILGPVLDGKHGFKAVPDTDQGRWDGNTRWDRAVGPMQFLPGTWRRFALDGDGDGVTDPQDVEDATATAAAYLCAGGRDLSLPATMRAAVLAYNASDAYARLVLTYQARFASLGLDNGAVTGLSTVVAGLGIPAVGTPVAQPSADPAQRAANPRALRHAATAAATATAAASPTARARRAAGSKSATPSTSPSTTPSTSTPSPVSTPGSGPTKSHAPSPSSKPTPSGSPSPTSQPTADPTTCPAVPTASPTSTASPTATASPTGTAGPSPTPGATCPPAEPSPTAASPSAAP